MAVRRFILLLLSAFVAWTLAASPVPFFRNFSPADYQASSQNWALAQDSRGFVYVGNNSGLLRFNGSSWELFHPFGEDIAKLFLFISPPSAADFPRLHTGTS